MNYRTTVCVGEERKMYLVALFIRLYDILKDPLLLPRSGLILHGVIVQDVQDDTVIPT